MIVLPDLEGDAVAAHDLDAFCDGKALQEERCGSIVPQREGFGHLGEGDEIDELAKGILLSGAFPLEDGEKDRGNLFDLREGSR